MSKLDDVARAICCPQGCERKPPCWVSPEDDYPQAHAALLAIREPGEDVLRRVAIAHCDVEWCKDHCECANDIPGQDEDVDPDCLARARRAVEALVDALLGGET